MEPSPRFCHCSALVEEKLYVWGGRKRTSELASSVYSFDQFLKLWAANESSGVPPPGLCFGTCASAGYHVYHYGGRDYGRRDGLSYLKSLHQLDTRSGTWKELSSAGPMRKRAAGMVAHDSKLVLFGGYGISSTRTQAGAELDSSYVFKTNGLDVFDLNKGMGESILLVKYPITHITWYRVFVCILLPQKRWPFLVHMQLPVSPNLLILPYFWKQLF